MPSFTTYLEALAPDFGLNNGWTWQQIPEKQRIRMIAAIRLTLMDLGAERKPAEPETTELKTEEQFDRRRYFAKPGEAEWGC